ncbi:MAG: glycosyltransferase family 2 protein [Rhabdochlamydiaceae bacterium]
MINESEVTIVIPHYGASKEMCYALKETQTSLYENSPEIKQLIVKNGGYKCDCAYDIKINDQGQCKAVNAAIGTINTPWIFITNDDMVYGSGWWNRFTFHLSPEIKCVSPILIEPRLGAPSFKVYFCGGAGGDFDKKKWNEFSDHYTPEVFPNGTILRRGFNFPVLIKKELFDLIGGYDMQYDPWGASGDTDLQCKVELAGIKTYQNTNCPVYHFSQTSGTFEPQNQGYWAKNYEYFREKWGFERPGDPDVWFSKDLIKYEQLKYDPWWKDFYKQKTTTS